MLAIMLVMTLAALGTQAQAKEKSLLPGGVTNACINVAEYAEPDGWQKLTERQIDASNVFRFTEYDRLHMVFSGLDLEYTRTSKASKPGDLDYDLYKGHLDDGRAVEITISPEEPDHLFMQVGNLHMKLMKCLHK